MGQYKDAKNPHHRTTIGRSDDAGRSRLCSNDSSTQHSGGNDTSGSSSHNSENRHDGEEDGNSSKERHGCRSLDHGKTKV